jgi:translation initiation factor 1
MAASNQSSQSSSDRFNGDRVVYSEFGNHPHQSNQSQQTTSSEALKRGTADLPPNQQNVRVEASRAGRKGKTVTVIRGVQANSDTLAALLKQLKTLCGAGGTVKETEIEIQGDHKQKIVEFLQKLGYKAKASGG